MIDAIPAATLIVMRENPGGPPELLMVERAATMAFAAGAWVFPGGRIDPGDHALAASIAPGVTDGAARVAAIRETLEETGVAIGFEAPAASLADMRARLAAGVAFGTLLNEVDATLDLSVSTPFARWCPAHGVARIFDTSFFIAEASPAAVASVDGTENVNLAWIAAATMLARANAGDARIVYPTRRNLERLATLPTIAAIRENALAYPVRTIAPFIETRDGTDHLCIPDGFGYPVLSEPVNRVVRG